MQAEYRRDTHHSYLVLYDEDGKSRESFQTRMFLENTIPGFLPCRVYDIDCSGRFFYDISSRQSLANILEIHALDQKMLEALLASLLRGLNGLQNYLLDTSGFCLKPEWIYRRPSGDSFEFCYFPEGELPWKDELKKLAEYLLPRLDHKNREAVRLGYRFYQNVMEDKITAAELEILLREEAVDGEDAENGKERQMGEPSLLPEGKHHPEEGAAAIIPASRDELLQAFFDPEDEKEQSDPLKKKQGKKKGLSEKGNFPAEIRPWIELLLPLLAGGVASFLFWYFRFDLAALVCGIATVGALAYILIRRWRRGKEQERDELMEQYVQVQDWLEEEKKEENYLQEKENLTEQKGKRFMAEEEDATCLLTSEEAYSRLAKGYLVPDASLGGPTIAINDALTMIGKSRQMDVVLEHMGISRTHAKIICRGDTCYLSDLNSRNGTRLNGILLKPEEEQVLSDGDRISFANAGYEWHCYRL